MRQAALIVCDGLRDDLITPDDCPNITTLARSGRRFTRHTAVFPSVTRPSAASIATGCHPGRHGLHGNAVALREGDRMVIRDVGKPAFRDRLRQATGATLHAPTLAERLADKGGAVILSNVSPGAAYFHDPDGFGHVYHRAGSFGPGLEPLAPIDAPPGAEGDRVMAERFCAEMLERRPALAVLWLSEPDRTAHHFGLGSPEHRAAIRAADRCVGMVLETARALRARGVDLLLLAGADHGMETIIETIPVDGLLVEAGLKVATDSDDVLVAPQGSAGLIYLHDEAAGRGAAIADWLRRQPWIDRLYVGDALADVHLVPTNGLAMAFSLRKSAAANRFGVPGLTCEAAGSSGVQEKAGLATHGGLGRFETRPFLVVEGGGFAPGSTFAGRTSVVDLAPTILRHLGQAHDDLDGIALARA